MTTLTVGRVTTLPRVNLLPPEIEQAAKFRRTQVLLALVVAGTLALVGGAYVLVSGQVSAAEDALAEAQAQNAQLQAQVAEYADVPRVQAELAKAEADLATAMGPEVRWSFYLNDLSLTIPSTVRLTTMAISQPTTTTTAADGTTSAVVSPLGTPGIATITFQGNATSYDAVASWLQMLARQKGYADATVTQVTDITEETNVGNVYNFSSSVTVTSDALSGRYLPTAGE